MIDAKLATASRSGSWGSGPEKGDAVVSNISYALLGAAVLAAAAVGAGPGHAQAAPPIRHMLVQYRPASGAYCADTTSRDAILRPSEARCDAEPGWTQQRVVMARR